MAKSKYFGYTLRNAGTPCQQWILSEIPVPTYTVFTSISTAAIPVNGNIPLSCIELNQFGGRLNPDGSFSLPSGMYRITYSFIASTTVAGEAIVELKEGITTVSTSEVQTAAVGAGFSGSIIGDVVVKSCGCNVCFNLINTSLTPITPVLAGTESVRAIITKIA